MRRVFVDKGASAGGNIVISGADARHITKVLRKRAGDSLLICDKDQNEYECEIISTGAEVTAAVKTVAVSENEPECRITLYQGIAKGEKMDWIIQKCTELGVCSFTPLKLKNCTVRISDDDAPKKTSRWQRIAAEACKQCGRGRIPEVTAPMTLEEAMSDAEGTCMLVMSEHELNRPLKEALGETGNNDISLFIGPEGGFDKSEISSLTEAGAVTATLGRRILRTETAAVAAAAIILYENGDMG